MRPDKTPAQQDAAPAINHTVSRPVKYAALFALGALFGTAQAAEDPPNFLFIWTDDQRWDAIGYTNPFVPTPNLDRKWHIESKDPLDFAFSEVRNLQNTFYYWQPRLSTTGSRSRSPARDMTTVFVRTLTS